MSEKAKAAMVSIAANLHKLSEFDLGYVMGKMEAAAEASEKAEAAKKKEASKK